MTYAIDGRFRVVVCALLPALATAIAACGGGGSGDGATPAPSPSPVATPSPLPSQSPTPSPPSSVGVMIQKVVGGGQASGQDIAQRWQGMQMLPAVRADVGWTGMTHRLAILQGASFTAALLGCDGENDTVCDISASVAGDFFGAPSPLAGAGISYCVTLAFVSDITGTINLATGDITELADLEARVYPGPIIEQPCPACLTVGPVEIGEVGVCSGGKRDGEPCTVEALGDVIFGAFRATSTECLPLDASEIGRFDVKVRPATTGRVSFSAGLRCTAQGYENERCWCDTCAGGTTPGEPCSSDFDCGGWGTCGGKRCLGGGDDGELCDSGTDCDSLICGAPGRLTGPNTCFGGVTDCIPAEDGVGGVCASGPEEGLCAGTPRACLDDNDCLGLHCITVLRPCFMNPIERAGIADPIVNDKAHPTMVGTMCFGPTGSSAVNSVAGFPGPVAFIWPSEITLVRLGEGSQPLEQSR